MSWFKRLKDGINTNTKNKKEAPDGLWTKCSSCKKTFATKEITENLWVCTGCDAHHRIGSKEYFSILFDGKGKYEELFTDISSKDILNWSDTKAYADRLEAARTKTNLNDAVSVAKGKLDRQDLIIACMDFSFIGGSMGSVVGEKIALAIKYSTEHKIPFLMISKSGGARMMESAFSLMQMAKTSALLTKLAKAGVPYLSFLTDPTTGGVSASYAMLGDINFSEPGTLIGFAGPRVIKETLKVKKLPEGFQTAEFLLDHGFLDFIVHRNELKKRISDILFIL